MVFSEDLAAAAGFSSESDLHPFSSKAAPATVVAPMNSRRFRSGFTIFENRKSVVFSQHQSPRHKPDMNAQPGHAVVLIDQHQADRQRNKKQGLHDQGQASPQADQQHDPGKNEYRAKQPVEGYQCEFR